MSRLSVIVGFIVAALAAAGLWSSLHEFAALEVGAHAHASWWVLLAPHHAFPVLGPLAPLMFVLSAAWRARSESGSWIPKVGVRELVGSILLLEGAELASGSMDHDWIMTALLVVLAMAISWLLAVLAVGVVSLLARRSIRVRRPRVQNALKLEGRDDVTHPSRAWLSRRSRRGPPMFLPTAA